MPRVGKTMDRKRTTRIQNTQRVCDEWNEAHPIGTAVRVWPGVREGDGIVTETTSEAQLLGGPGGTAVVWTKARPCMALTHVEALS